MLDNDILAKVKATAQRLAEFEKKKAQLEKENAKLRARIKKLLGSRPVAAAA
jgi:cell division protein FtsB